MTGHAFTAIVAFAVILLGLVAFGKQQSGR